MDAENILAVFLKDDEVMQGSSLRAIIIYKLTLCCMQRLCGRIKHTSSFLEGQVVLMHVPLFFISAVTILIEYLNKCFPFNQTGG